MFPLGCQKIGQKIPKKTHFLAKNRRFLMTDNIGKVADTIGQDHRYYRPIYRYRSFTTYGTV